MRVRVRNIDEGKKERRYDGGDFDLKHADAASLPKQVPFSRYIDGQIARRSNLSRGVAECLSKSPTLLTDCNLIPLHVTRLFGKTNSINGHLYCYFAKATAMENLNLT
jgi:hypothetical protein